MVLQALNPTKLWKESARERAEAQEDENVIVVQVRGNDARTLLDQTTATRDDTGAIIEDDDDEEEELGFGTAMIESGSIGLDEMESILLEKRKERNWISQFRQINIQWRAVLINFRGNHNINKFWRNLLKIRHRANFRHP